MVPAASVSRSSWSPLAGPVVVGAAAGALAVCLLIRDPAVPGTYPLCPFRAITGWDCPGCGALRALADLCRGDLAGAIDRNLLVVAMLPYLLWRWGIWAWSGWQESRGQPPPRIPQASTTLIVLLCIVVLAFWVVRNIPGVPVLASTVTG